MISSLIIIGGYQRVTIVFRPVSQDLCQEDRLPRRREIFTNQTEICLHPCTGWYILHTGWWFGTWILFFHSVGNNHPNWPTHIFRGVGIPPTSSFGTPSNATSHQTPNLIPREIPWKTINETRYQSHESHEISLNLSKSSWIPLNPIVPHWNSEISLNLNRNS